MNQSKKAVKAIGRVTLVAGVGAVTWIDPDTAGTPASGAGTLPVTVELEYVPQCVLPVNISPGGLVGIPTIGSVTKNGCTLTSIWPGGGPADVMVGDTSTYLIYAACAWSDF